MISLHAGRLLLVCKRCDGHWYARVVLGQSLSISLRPTQAQCDCRMR